MQSPPPNLALGIFLAAASAIGLGCAVAFSRMAYEGGTNALTVAAVRSLGVIVLTGGAVAFSARRFRLEGTRFSDLLGLGLLLAYMFWGNIAAVQYISVGLAALLFFVYPPVVALVMVLAFGARFSILKLVAIVSAFAGLALALGVTLTGLRFEGVALSLSAGIACAAHAIWVGQRMRAADPLVLTFHMSWIAAMVLWIALASQGGPVAPSSASGWFGASAVVALQVLCVPMYVASIRHAGPETSTMVTNVQPVASIVAAYLLYAELMTPWQGLGAAMVIGGIVLTQLADRRLAR